VPEAAAPGAIDWAALVAAAGVAVGMASSGLLGNFAAGAFLLILRPFKVGDFIEAGGITGTVREIRLPRSISSTRTPEETTSK
jgi:small conductance mechanosensitive channel